MQYHKFHFLLLIFIFLYAGSLYAQERGLSVVSAPITGGNIGKQVAVFIAIDRYREWPSLRHAVNDAEQLRMALEKKYYIDTTYCLYDEDATKSNVIKQFDKLTKELQPEDSLFIYYAGHGHFDNITNTGFWILQDGTLDRYKQDGWLPNPIIRSLIYQMKSRHIFLVSDSCFSGDLLSVPRGTQLEINDEYFKRAYERRSRQVLTSGADETVPDESSFTHGLIKFLEENRKPYIDPYLIYNDIRLSALSTTPLLGSLKDTDAQEGGSFLFFLKGELSKTAISVQPSTSSKDTGILSMPYVPKGMLVRINSAQVFLSNETTRSGSYELPAGNYDIELVSFNGGSAKTFSTRINIKKGTQVIPRALFHDVYDYYEKQRAAASSYKKNIAFRGMKWVFGALGLAGGGIFYILGNNAYQTYKTATDPELISESRSTVETMGVLMPVSFIIGGGIIISIPLTNTPKPDTGGSSIDEYIQNLDGELTNLSQWI
jgi:hypothetical protein